MQRTKLCFIAGPSLIVCLLLTSLSWAQIDVGEYTISGEAEVGGLPRNFSGSKAKFEEYRDIPETVIVPQLQLMIGGKKEDFYATFNSLETGRNDQSYTLRAGKYGLLDMEFQWDQIPHLFSEGVARTPYAESGGRTRFFTLSSKPTATTATSDCATSPICQWVNGAASPIDLSLYNGIGRFNLRYTPTPGWTFTGTYWSNHNVGDRAFGSLFGTSPGSFNITELAEPINYQTHNIELGGEYAGSGWSLAFKYGGSIFNNLTSSIVWDNPINLTCLSSACRDTAAYQTNGTGGPCQGRLDLYPNNQAHTFSLTGTAALPMKTQFLSTVSYGWRIQDDSFLPMTINRCFTRNPGQVGLNNPALTGCNGALVAMPQASKTSLNGDVRPFMANTTLVNNYFDHLNLKAYYRWYDLQNRSSQINLPNGWIINDSGTQSATQNTLYAYSKGNMGLEGTYNIFRWLSAKLAYGWEAMHRHDREIFNSNEYSLGPTFDIKPNQSLLFRFLYRHYWRDVSAYEAEGDIANISRKFDEAKRNRDKISFFSEYTPWEQLSFHSGYEFTSDRYPNTGLGTQYDHNYSPSVGLIYAPSDWIKIFTDYNWERFDWRLFAMQRANTAQTPATNPALVWTSRGKDQVHTVSVGSDMSLIKNLLAFRIQYSYSNGVSQVHSSGDTAGSVPATNYPDVKNQWHELLLRFQYELTRNIALKVGYYFNHATERDFGVDIMKPWMGDVDVVPTPNANVQRSIFLGDQIKGPFSANVGFLAVRFKF